MSSPQEKNKETKKTGAAQNQANVKEGDLGAIKERT